MDTIVLPVMGVYFRGAEVKVRAEELQQGEPLRLIAEPDNQYDNFAVKVCCLPQASPEDYFVDAKKGGFDISIKDFANYLAKLPIDGVTHLGYIPATHSAHLQPFLDQVETCTFSHHESDERGNVRPMLSITLRDDDL